MFSHKTSKGGTELGDQASFTNVSICLLLFATKFVYKCDNYAPLMHRDTFSRQLIMQIWQIRQTADKPFILQTLALNYFSSIQRHVGHCHARIHASGPMVAHIVYGAKNVKTLDLDSSLPEEGSAPDLARFRGNLPVKRQKPSFHMTTPSSVTKEQI